MFPIFQTKNYLRFIKLKIRFYPCLYEVNPRHPCPNYAAKPPRNTHRIPQRRRSEPRDFVAQGIGNSQIRSFAQFFSQSVY